MLPGMRYGAQESHPSGIFSPWTKCPGSSTAPRVMTCCTQAAKLMAKGSHSRLILTVLLALALGIAAYFAYSVNWYRQDRVARRADECLALSRMADKAALAFVDRYVALFQGVARVQAVQRHDAAASSELFRELSTAFPACENIAATGVEGCFFASVRPLTDPPPCITSREFFQRLASGAPLAVMQPHQGPITGELVTGVVVPIPGKDGRFEGIVGASIAFSALSVRWDELVESSDLALVVYGQSGVVHYASGNFASLTGEGLNGRAGPLHAIHSEGGIPVTVFDGVEYVAGVVQSSSSGLTMVSLTSRNVSLADYFRAHPETYWILTCMALLLATSAYLQWKDRQWIKTLSASEKRFRMILEHSPVGIAVYMADTGQCVAANEAIASLIGADLEQVLRQNFLEIESWKTSGMFELAQKALTQGGPRRMDLRMTTTFGKDVALDCLLARFDLEKTRHLLLIASDMSEKARMQEIMIQTEKMMSLGGLAAGMAHEINNPLSGILQSSQVMMRRLKDDTLVNREAALQAGCTLENIWGYMKRRDGYALLRGIRDSAKRASNIVVNMLAFSRKTGGEMVSADLNDLLDKAVELSLNDYDLKKKYDFRKVEIVREYEPGLPPVECTASQIEQVVLNLLRNAAQAMRCCTPGMPQARLVLRTRREDGYARIEVEDNGPGMDEDVRKRVFEPFFSTKPPGEGTGLGLSVSYYIITSNHRGTFEVESKPDHGTRFIIRLPFQASPATGEDESSG